MNPYNCSNTPCPYPCWLNTNVCDANACSLIWAVHALAKQLTAIVSSTLTKTVLVLNYHYQVRREAALALVNVCISTSSIYPHCLFSEERDDGWAAIDRKPVKKNIFKTIYSYTRWCWVLLALASLALQATRTATSSATHKELLSLGEMGMTFAFDLEIIVKILAALPDWRTFFVHGQNWLDIILAVGSSIIQIPVIKNSTVYPWFTLFQLARFYRVILEVPRMRPLLVSNFPAELSISSEFRV